MCIFFLSTVQVCSSLHHCLCADKESLADKTLQGLLDELEAAFVQKRILLLWLADVEVIHVYLDEFSDAEVWNETRLSYLHLQYRGIPHFLLTLVLHTCGLFWHHNYFDHRSDVCGLRFCEAHHLKVIFLCDVHKTFIQTGQSWWILTKMKNVGK